MTASPEVCKIPSAMTDKLFHDLLADKARELAPRYKPRFLHRRQTVFQFIFDESAPFYLIASETDFSFAPGDAPSPTLTLYIDTHETCWGLLEGRLDGMKMFMEGRYRADGNIVLSQLLLYLFKSEDDAKFYEVQD